MLDIMKSSVAGTLLLLIVTSFSVHSSDVASGGKTSVRKEGANAFSLPAANLPMSKRLDFSVGNSFFRNPWVQAPASTDARDGLGPLFNTNGCQNCHIKDGRGHAPREGDTNAVSMLVRLSIPALTPEQKKRVIIEGVIPEPIYGGQLQDFSLSGVKPEGQIHITYSEKKVQLSDGDVVTLRKPHLSIKELAYGAMDKNVLMSARVAPPMIGLGLLESIPESTILEFAKKQLQDNNGISGKANRVWDAKNEALVLGRFGWKAGQPSLMQQNAAAFNGDLGLTSNLFPKDDCTQAQTICEKLPHGGTPEVSDKILNFVEFYSQHLAVPIRRNVKDPQVIAGQRIFKNIGCESCHQSNIKTANITNRPALSNQTIHPYTDMLLHDMGEGLSDNRPEFLADGQEWRTSPLWGLGYLQEVNGHTEMLHDGRARNALEAILWHGGEAQQSRDDVVKLSTQDRNALLAFLASL